MRQLNYLEMQAVMAYLKALEDGQTSPPESVGILDEEILDAIRQAKDFQILVGQIDHNHVFTVVELMTQKDPHWADEATRYMPSTAIH